MIILYVLIVRGLINQSRFKLKLKLNYLLPPTLNRHKVPQLGDGKGVKNFTQFKKSFESLIAVPRTSGLQACIYPPKDRKERAIREGEGERG